MSVLIQKLPSKRKFSRVMFLSALFIVGNASASELSFYQLVQKFSSARVPTAEDLQVSSPSQFKTWDCNSTGADNVTKPDGELRYRFKEIEEMPAENLPVIGTSNGDFMTVPGVGLVGNRSIFSDISVTTGDFGGVSCANHVIPAKYVISCVDSESIGEFEVHPTNFAITTFISTPNLRDSGLQVFRTYEAKGKKHLIYEWSEPVTKDTKDFPESVAAYRSVTAYGLCTLK